ncbi:hypothetical protein HMPREF2738_02866 [Clostridiales bacterium KLE1615]|nr:hypothetical protein HMPREF2738_02866 [Clostridiales bacterium KLE1615]
MKQLQNKKAIASLMTEKRVVSYEAALFLICSKNKKDTVIFHGAPC